MKFNTDWLFSLYQEEAGADGAASGGGEGAAVDGGDNQPASDQPAEPQEGADNPEWLLPKYMTDGRSKEDAISEQAKAYNELQGRFGSFTGAPEEYEVSISEQLTEAGLDIKSDDPMVQEAMKFAKESNMSQDGFNKMIELYGMQQVAEHKALEEYRTNEMKQLGPNADSRIDNIIEWGSKNLDEETFKGLQGMANSAEAVKVIESLVGMTRSAPVDASNTPSPGVSAEEVRSMQFEKDEHGNRKINSDPEFRARYMKARNAVYGTDDHKVVIR